MQIFFLKKGAIFNLKTGSDEGEAYYNKSPEVKLPDNVMTTFLLPRLS